MTEQCVKENHNGRCCCCCYHLLIDHSHPETDGEDVMHPRGFICVHPDLGAFSGWSKHGLCEEWKGRQEK